jgi:hypothetical protein
MYSNVGMGDQVGTFTLPFENGRNSSTVPVMLHRWIVRTVCPPQGWLFALEIFTDVPTDGNEHNRNGLIPNDLSLKRDVTSMTRVQSVYMTRNGRSIWVPTVPTLATLSGHPNLSMKIWSSIWMRFLDLPMLRWCEGGNDSQSMMDLDVLSVTFVSVREFGFLRR